MSIRLKLAGGCLKKWKRKWKGGGGGDPTDVEAGRRGLPRQFFNLISGSFPPFILQLALLESESFGS